LVITFDDFVIVFVQQDGNIWCLPTASWSAHVDADWYLALMVNMAGMIPIIFAQSSDLPGLFQLEFADRWTQFAEGGKHFGRNNIYWIMYFLMVFLFSFFLHVLFAQQNYGENLKAQAKIPV
jgi:preprotein translocase subunit SecY